MSFAVKEKSKNPLYRSPFLSLSKFQWPEGKPISEILGGIKLR